MRNPEAAALELSSNSIICRTYVPTLSPFRKTTLNTFEDMRSMMTSDQILEEMLDLHSMATELVMLLCEHGVTEEKLAILMGPYAGSDLPDDILDYLTDFGQAADELAEERSEQAERNALKGQQVESRKGDER